MATLNFKRTVKRIAARLAPESNHHSVVLAYHSIGGGSPFSQPVELFREQLRILTEHFTIVPLPGLLETLATGRERLAAITFDDGFEDLYTSAFPILNQARLPFTVFLTTAFLEGGSASFQWSPHYSGLPPLTWSQVREMMSRGCHVGSHTHSHPRLSDCTVEEIDEELKQSRHTIEHKTRTEVSALAYPFGQPHDYDQRVISAAAATGYRCAFTGLQRCIHSVPDRYEIPRITIDATDGREEFIQKITGQRDFVARLERFNSALIRTGLRPQPVAAPRSRFGGPPA